MKRILIIFSIVIFNWQVFSSDKVTFEERKEFLEKKGLVQVFTEKNDGSTFYGYSSPYYKNFKDNDNSILFVGIIISDELLDSSLNNYDASPKIFLMSPLLVENKAKIIFLNPNNNTFFNFSFRKFYSGTEIESLVIEKLASTQGLEFVNVFEPERIYKVSNNNRNVILEVVKIYQMMANRILLQKFRESGMGEALLSEGKGYSSFLEYLKN